MRRTCQHLNRRSLDYCGDYADFVIATGFKGQAACRKHLGPLIVPAMGADGGALPARSVTVVPTHLYREEA